MTVPKTPKCKIQPVLVPFATDMNKLKLKCHLSFQSMPALKRTRARDRGPWNGDAELGFLGYTHAWNKLLMQVMKPLGSGWGLTVMFLFEDKAFQRSLW